MKKATLYQYSILWHPTTEEAANGKKTEVLIEPNTMLAVDQNSAFIQVSRLINEKYLTSLDQVEIMIRPF